MKVHHTTIREDLGLCPICGKPFLTYWEDDGEQHGRSDTYTEKKGANYRFVCLGGKSLQQLNEERKNLKTK
jgi:hypothetical protein